MAGRPDFGSLGTGQAGSVSLKFKIPDTLTPEQRKEADRLLGELARMREDNPLSFYKPHAKQAAYHKARTHLKAFLGGNQSGKTTAGLADDLIQAVDRECLPAELQEVKRFEPPFRCRVAAPDFTSTMEGAIFEKLRELAPKSQLRGGSWDKAYDKQRRRLEFANGSWFDFLTYEQDLDKWGSVTLDRVHFDEEPPGEKGRQMYLQARSRVMARRGDICFTMTPEFGMSWMFDEVFERRDEPDVTVVQVATDENTYLAAEAVEEAFSRLSDEEQEYKRKGRFVAFGGLVVNLTDRHFVTTDEMGGEDALLEHVRGLPMVMRIMDPGAAQGAVSWIGVDKDDVMLVFDELYPSGSTENDIDVLVPKILEKDAYYGVEPYELIDPSSRNTAVGRDTGIEDALFAKGLYPTRAKNNRFHSIMQLRRRVAADPPGLVVVRDRCPKTVWEANRWRVAEDENADRVKRGQSGDTFATTGPDHLWDTIRYGALEVVWGPVDEKPRERSHYQATPVYSDFAKFERIKRTDAPSTGALT